MLRLRPVRLPHPQMVQSLRQRVMLIFTAILTCAGGTFAMAQTQISLERIAQNLSWPVFVTAPPGDDSRLFVVEARAGDPIAGRIRVINRPQHTINSTPYLSIQPVGTLPEQGLLGLAFHPNFLSNGYFWVNYTDAAGDTIIARYRATPPFLTSTAADPQSATTLVRIHQPFANHNGGWIAFGPDGDLYTATGDGGSANDPGNNAQNIGSLLGKLLRMDVDGPDNIPGNDDDQTTPQIFALGLRNPWRCAFDRATGKLYIADVGEGNFEEVNVLSLAPPPSQPVNFGWRCMEALACTGLPGCACNSPELRPPIFAYDHAGGQCSIIGGLVYQGCAMPAIHGHYFFADYCSSHVYSMHYTGDGTAPAGPIADHTADLAASGHVPTLITSFGEDADGEMFMCDQAGNVYQIIPGPGQISHCCPADIAPPPPQMRNEKVDIDDLFLVISSWGPCPAPPLDCHADIIRTGSSAGIVNVDDLFAVINAWGPCP
jgi:glucose/arabinose dehydrogenase